MRLRNLVMTVPALFVVAVATPASAASWVFGLNGGAGVPMATIGDDWKTGLLMGGTADYLLNDHWAVGVDVAWTKLDPSDEYKNVWLAPNNQDAEFTFIRYGVRGKWMIPTGGSPLTPYLLGTVGTYNLKKVFTSPGFSDEFKQTAFGLGGGAGAMWKVTRVLAIGGEVDYHHVVTDENKINFGHDGAPFVGIRGGLLFTVPPGP